MVWLWLREFFVQLDGFWVELGLGTTIWSLDLVRFSTNPSCIPILNLYFVRIVSSKSHRLMTIVVAYRLLIMLKGFPQQGNVASKQLQTTSFMQRFRVPSKGLLFKKLLFGI